MRWSPRDKIELSQIVLTQPRLRPVQLPWVGKWVSNNVGRPIRCICSSNSGMSSTRSVMMIGISFLPRAELNLELTSKFGRTVRLIFADDSKLHFSEYLDQTGEVVDKLMYTYPYQDTGNQLIFRYGNALHKPGLSSVAHKHLPAQTTEAPPPILDEVL